MKLIKRAIIAGITALGMSLLISTAEAHSTNNPVILEPETERYEVEEGKANEEMVVPKQDTFDEMAVETEEVGKESDLVIETPAQKYFDVPLSTELQDYIFALCEEHNIAPGIIIAMIEQESNYKSDAIGDGGRSEGLMQIQRRWNQERMDRLGCQNLLDPYQNVTVGIDLVAERKAQNSDLMWVLMSYNGGIPYADEMFWNGKISDYAWRVVNRATELNEGRR